MRVPGKYIAIIVVVVLVVVTGTIFLSLWLSGTFPTRNVGYELPTIPTNTIYKTEDLVFDEMEDANVVNEEWIEYEVEESEETADIVDEVFTNHTLSESRYLQNIHPSPLPSSGDHFGETLASMTSKFDDTHYLFVGAPTKGEVMVFQEIEGRWEYKTSIVEPTPTTGNAFGKSMVQDHNYLCVVSNTHIYFFNEISERTFVQTTPIPVESRPFDKLLHVTSSTVIVSTTRGGVQCYTLQEDRWVLLTTLVENHKITGGCVQGTQLFLCGEEGMWKFETKYAFTLHRWDLVQHKAELTGNELIHGPLNTLLQSVPSQQYIRVLDSALEEQEIVKVPGVEEQESSLFGHAVAYNHQTQLLVVGAPHDYREIVEDGSVFVYKWSSYNCFLPCGMIKAEEQTPHANFGSTILFNGTHAVFVSSLGSELDAGNVVLYDLISSS